MVNKRPGRPADGSDAREQLIAAAQRLLTDGHPATISTRRIARDAGVSHSLVNYHFGSKDDLILTALSLTIAPHHVVRAATAGGTLDVTALATGIVRLWDHPDHGPRLVRFAREIASDGTRAALLSSYLENAVFGGLAAAVGNRTARRLAVIIVGTIFTRYVLALPLMAAQPSAEVIRQFVDLAGPMPPRDRPPRRSGTEPSEGP